MRTIEEKLHQKSFRNEYHKLFLNLTYTANRLSAEMDDILAPYALTTQQFNILRILRGQGAGSASICSIRERLVDNKADVSRLVDRLLKKKLISRDICPDDRRRVDVRITDQGLQLLAAIDRKEAEIDALLGHLSTEDAQHLNLLLDKIGK